MADFVTLVRLAMAAVLLWAGLEKARSPKFVISALRQLGVPKHRLRAAFRLLVGLELAVGLGLIFGPRSAATIGGLVVLATAFAGAGLIALIGDEAIHCGCFGPGSDGYLGTPQLAAFPFWLGAVVLLALEAPAHVSFGNGASAFAMVALTVAAVRSVAALKASNIGRGDRRSASEMYAWLRW